MYLQATFLLLLCTGFDVSASSQPQRYPRASEQCNSFVDGPFDFCSKGGYNTTFEFPEILTDSLQKTVAVRVQRMMSFLGNCSRNGLAETMVCSFFMPQCSEGKRVYPCKRVCGEFMKQCEEALPVRFVDYFIASCHVLPDEFASSGKCFEPPNFKTNDSIKGPLDRDCQELIIPACKNLGVSNYTLMGIDAQKHWYFRSYNEEYSRNNVKTDFPPEFQKALNKYPKCQANLKKMFCGEFFPPCFPDEESGFYSICKSVCDDIVRDCPEFFRNDFRLQEAEYCALLGRGNSSHGHCKRAEWPKPFSWVRFMRGRERPTKEKPTKEKPTDEAPSKGPKSTKVWVIVVAVLVGIIIVGLILLGAICYKLRRRVPGIGYKKQQDDMTPLETSVDL